MMSATITYGERLRSLERDQETAAHDAPMPPAFPKSGEVWMCTLGQNLGREQNGGPRDFSRPVLVIKKFNNEIFWVVPLSTKTKVARLLFQL